MSVGDAMAQARIAAGMSIDDLAGLTKIRPSILQAMEAGDFSGCGGDVYARGQIRSIAQLIGLDPDEAVARFDAER